MLTCMDVDVAWWGGLYEGWWAQLPMAMPPYVPWEGSKCLPSALHHHPFLFYRSNQHVTIFAVILYLETQLTRGLLILCCRERCSLCKFCSGLVNRCWLMYMQAQWGMFLNPMKSLKRNMSHRSLWLIWISIRIMTHERIFPIFPVLSSPPWMARRSFVVIFFRFSFSHSLCVEWHSIIVVFW